MIENLKGIHETVNYKSDTGLRLYVNDELVDYPPHWHAPIEIICPLESGYEAMCSNHTFHLRMGDILIVGPGTIHALSAPKDGIRIIFQANCQILYGIKRMETIISLISPAMLITPEKLPGVYHQVYRLILEIKEEYSTNSLWSEATIYSKLIELLVLVGRHHTVKESWYDSMPRKRQESNEKLLSVCNYIQEHCTEELTLDDVANKGGFSKYYFDRLFKQFTGVSFYRYLNQKRIALAEELLINPDVSVTEVAYRSGFSSVSSFTRMFKIIKLCTPSEFRKMYNKN